MRSLAIVILLGCLSLAASAATFSDQSLEAGYLNPGDEEIQVQEIRARGHSTQQTTFNSVQIRNTGTATHQHITRIELRNGGVTIAEVDDPVGLNTSSGITLTATHAIPAGATQYLSVHVWLAGADDISGGETVALGVRFHYLVGGSAGSSAWISDGRPEEIEKAGFEEITDTSPDPFNMNPGDSEVVQVASFRDDDANTSDVHVERIILENVGSATGDDIASYEATITYGGDEYVAAGVWPTGGVDLEHDDFDGWDGVVADQGEIVVALRLDVAAPGDVTDGRTLRGRITLNVTENGEQLEHSNTSPSTHTIRKAGLEYTEDTSSIPATRILNPGETLTQRVVVRDEDVNALDVTVTGIWIRNLGTADHSDIKRIEVRVGNTLVHTVEGGDLNNIRAGKWFDFAPANTFTVEDNESKTVTTRYIADDTITEGRTLRPRVRFKNDEGVHAGYESPTATYAEEVELRRAGFEFVEDLDLEAKTYFSGQRILAQKIRVEDKDQNTNSVVINPVTVRNLGTAPDGSIARIEVRNAAGDLLGQTTDASGFSSGGVTISTLQNNVVGDNRSAELHIWITLAGPDDTEDDDAVRTETTIRHTEDGVAHQRTVTGGTTFTVEVNHPPEVNFSFSPTDPTWEDTITFEVTKAEDPDGDDIVEFEWNFGDGTVLTRDDPVDVTHQYGTGGTFQVTLTAADERGMSGSRTRTVAIEGPPDLSPQVDFSWEPEEPETGEEVSFTSEVTDPADPPLTPYTYGWDFGDGNTSDEENPTHTYETADTYTVELVVTNTEGESGSITHEITVTPRPTPAPTLGQLAVSPQVPEAGQEVTFSVPTEAPDDDPATEWEWDFGDGNEDTTTENEVAHMYQSSGQFTVRVRASNEEGGWSNWRTKQIYVRQPGAEPIGTRLTQNPVAAQAVIQIFAPEGTTNMRIFIFDLRGRQVYEAPVAGGEVTWNLTDDRGRTVPSGVYFYLVSATLGDTTIRSETGRIMVVR